MFSWLYRDFSDLMEPTHLSADIFIADQYFDYYKLIRSARIRSFTECNFRLCESQLGAAGRWPPAG